MQPLTFEGLPDIQQAFDTLTIHFEKILIHNCNPFNVVELCKSYCSQHWNDENFSSSLFNVSSVLYLFDTLKISPFYNFLNLGLLRFLAASHTFGSLTASVRNYEETFNSVKLQDLQFIREIKVAGANIPKQDHALIVSVLKEQDITIGQLQKMCTPRYLHLYNTVTLDFGVDLPDFYHSIKVNNWQSKDRFWVASIVSYCSHHKCKIALGLVCYNGSVKIPNSVMILWLTCFDGGSDIFYPPKNSRILCLGVEFKMPTSF